MSGVTGLEGEGVTPSTPGSAPKAARWAEINLKTAKLPDVALRRLIVQALAHDGWSAGTLQLVAGQVIAAEGNGDLPHEAVLAVEAVRAAALSENAPLSRLRLQLIGAFAFAGWPWSSLVAVGRVLNERAPELHEVVTRQIADLDAALKGSRS